MRILKLLALVKLSEQENKGPERWRRLKLACLLRMRTSLRTRYFLHSSSLVPPPQSAWNKLYASKDSGSLLLVRLGDE